MRRGLSFGLVVVLVALAFVPVGVRSMTAILPDGRRVSPAGFTVPVEGFASQLALSPDGAWLAVLDMDGVIDFLSTDGDSMSARLPLSGATRMLWTKTGLFVACGYLGKIARFQYTPPNARAFSPGPSLTRLPDLSAGSAALVNGLAEDRAAHKLYAALTANREVVAIDESIGTVVQHLQTTGQPFAVALDHGTLFATIYNSTTVDAWPGATGHTRVISSGAHPTEILVTNGAVYVANADGHDVSIIDPFSLTVKRHIELTQNAAEPPGRTPSGMALSIEGTQLYVAESGTNDVAVVNLRNASVIERIPTGWYPMSVVATPAGSYTRASLWIASAKGYGSQPDAAGEWDGTYTGLVQRVVVGVKLSSEYAPPAPPVIPTVTGPIPPIRHIVFIVKENKHFDEELSDLPNVDGDTKLLLYGRKYTPNLHALGLRYTVFDRFLSNGEASIYGHAWTTKGWTNDYQERNSRFGGVDYAATTSPLQVPVSIWPEPLVFAGLTDAALDFDWFQDLWLLPHQPRVNVSGVFGPRGELIDELQRHHVSFRVYGEQMTMLPSGAIAPGLAAHADREYPGAHIDFGVHDTQRARLFLKDLQRHGLAAYTYMTLPTDHTAGTSPGYLTPASYIADNDAALGMIIEGLSKRPEWASTIVFVTMDDPQGTGDHYDSHRMPAVMIGPYARHGYVDHTRYDQASVLRTVEVIFHLDPLSINDAAAPPILDAFARQPDLALYHALPANIPIVSNPGMPQHMSFLLDGPGSQYIPMQEWLSVRGPRSLQEHLAYLAQLGISSQMAYDRLNNEDDDDAYDNDGGSF